MAGVIGLVFFPALVAFDIIKFRNWLPIYQSIPPFIFGLISRAVVLGTLTASSKAWLFINQALRELLAYLSV